MRVRCKKNLYWYQQPGYTGTLSEKSELDGREGELVLKEGKKYPIYCSPYQDRNNLEYIFLYVIGEDLKTHSILRQEIPHQSTEFALKYFDFPPMKERGS